MGHTLEMFQVGKEEGMHKWRKEFGEIFGIYSFWVKPTLVITDPEILKGKCLFKNRVFIFDKLCIILNYTL